MPDAISASASRTARYEILLGLRLHLDYLGAYGRQGLHLQVVGVRASRLYRYLELRHG